MTSFDTVRVAAVQATPEILDASGSVEASFDGADELWQRLWESAKPRSMAPRGDGEEERE